jgi:hypothetical protein
MQADPIVRIRVSADWRSGTLHVARCIVRPGTASIAAASTLSVIVVLMRR